MSRGVSADVSANVSSEVSAAAEGQTERAAGADLVAEVHALVAATLEVPAESFGADEDLMTLGIDSLKAIEVQQALEGRFGVSLPLEQFFEGVSVVGLAGAIRAQRGQARAGADETASRMGNGATPVRAGTAQGAVSAGGVGAGVATGSLAKAGGEKLARRRGKEREWPERGWLYRGWGRGLHLLNGPLDLLFRSLAKQTTILGREHLEGLPKQVIFGSSHRSYLDPQLLRIALKRTAAKPHGKGLIVVGGTFGFGHAVGRWAQLLAMSTGVYLIDNDGKDQVVSSLHGLLQTAGGSSSLLMYPQGIHVRVEDELRGAPISLFKSGVGWLARETGAPVVPCGVAGTERLLPGDIPEGFKGPIVADIAITLGRGPVAIAFGAPLRIGDDETPQAFARRLQAVCYGLSRAAEAAIGRN